jgi:hypothetical protein
MSKIHHVEGYSMDESFFYLTVDGTAYRIRWDMCSERLTHATQQQRQHVEVSPSGYGLHWPEIDEDLAVTPLIEIAEVLPYRAVSHPARPI